MSRTRTEQFSTIHCLTDSLSTLHPWLVPQSWNSTVHWVCIPSLMWCVKRFSPLGMISSFLVKAVLSLLPDVLEKVSHCQAYSYSVLALSACTYAASARYPSRAEHPLIFCPRTEVSMVSCSWLSISFKEVFCKPGSTIWIHLWLRSVPQAEEEWVGLSPETLSGAGCQLWKHLFSASSVPPLSPLHVFCQGITS